jgi:CRP-like cAMP-binding protein
MEPAACLARYPLFALLGRQGLEAWTACGRVQPAQAGETIFEAGTPGTWAFLVLEGQVRVLRSSRPERDFSLGLFGPGEVFGEYALLPPHLNTATCRAARPGRLPRLPLLPLQTFTRRPEVQPNLKSWLRLNVLVGFLRERAFLGFLSAGSSLPLLDRCQELTFPDEHTIQADGLGDDRWHFLQAGQVSVEAGGGATVVLGRGDCFGERALLGRGGLPAAVARGEVRCLALHRADFGPAPARGGQPSIQTTYHQPGREPFPWVGQQEAGDCGVAALAMIARCHGRQENVGPIRRLVEVGEEGASLLGLQQAATALGLPCRAVRLDPARLAEVALPALAHLAEGHFVAVYAAGPGGVVVGDPASAVVTWSAAFFRQGCSGRLLVFGPALAAPHGS